MIGDITLLKDGAFGAVGSRKYKVAISSTTIKAGEPVSVTLGTSGTAVIPAATNTPVVSTDFYVGIAATTSDNTASAAGTVEVIPLVDGQVFLIKPNAPTAFDTQAEYDALVGSRVLIDLTTSTYTLLATDGATYGCVIVPLDIAKYPGKVAFAFRAAVSYLA